MFDLHDLGGWTLRKISVTWKKAQAQAIFYLFEHV